MELFFSILRHTLAAMITVVDIALLLRAIMSWFVDPTEENKFCAFLFVLTEPFIIPVRRLFERYHWMENSPVDVPFFIVVLIFWILRIVI